MSVKIGEMLVKAGGITQEQLEEALRYQVIFGGKLGTNLIELGYLDEEEIAYFLSEKLRVPYVHPVQLMNIPPDVIKVIPGYIAKKYKIIPISIEKKRLNLAMTDPSDLPAIDEISFITNLSIKPLVAPEVRIILALEKYYNIERDVRYIPIIEKVEKKKREKTAGTTEDVEVKPEEYLSPPETETVPPLKPEGIDIPEEELEEAEIIEDEARKKVLEQHTIDALSKRLAETKDREEIADLIVDYFGQEFDGVALFIVRRNSAVGWKAVRNGKKVEGMDKLHVTLEEDSVLKTVVEGKSYYLGPVPGTPNNSKITATLGVKLPLFTLSIPILIMGKVVSIFCVDGGNVELGMRVVDLQKVASKAAMAFEILILKNKIMMT